MRSSSIFPLPNLSLSLSVLIWQPSSPFYIYFCTVWCVDEKIASKRDRDEIEKKEKNKQDAKKIPKNIYANPFSHFPSMMMMMMKMMMCALMGGIFIWNICHWLVEYFSHVNYEKFFYCQFFVIFCGIV